MTTSLVMALRKRMPKSLRSIVRVLRSVSKVYVPSPRLPASAFAEARLMASREALIASLPKGGRVLEIGTDRGDFARKILALAEPESLSVIDIDYSRFDDRLRADPRITCLKGAAQSVLAGFEPHHFNWIYVDASHTYADVKADARAAARVVRPGGYLVFNDFAHIDPFLGRYGVHRAVSEFILESGWQIHAMSYDPHGLYDLALRAGAPAARPNASEDR